VETEGSVEPKHRTTGSLVCVTHLGEFVAACLDLVDRGAPYGTYHVSNPGLLDLRKFAAGFVESAASGVSARLRPDTGEISMDALESFFLDDTKLRNTGICLRPASTALRTAIDSLFSGGAGRRAHLHTLSTG
jgi:hypothetical protein